MASSRYGKSREKAVRVLLVIAMTLMGSLVSFALQAPTTAHAASSGSIAVFDSADGTLKLYNATTAASYVATGTQTTYTGIDEATPSQEESDAPWSAVKDQIKAVVAVDDGIQPDDLSSWFDGCSALESVDLSKLDTSQTRDFKDVFQGCFSITEANLSGWSTIGLDAVYDQTHCPSLADSHMLRRLTIGNETRLTDAPLPEHPIKGTTDQNWELEGGDGTPVSTTSLSALINSGGGEGTWVWHTMTAIEFENSARIEERALDPIDKQWVTATDGHNGQNISHRIAATFPSAITSYSSFPITIEDALGGLELFSTNDITIDIDGVDITNEVKSGGYGAIVNADGTLTITIGDALSGFGKGLTVNNQSVLSVNYQAHTTGASSSANTTYAKMTYPSPPSRPTVEPSETAVANTLTGSYTMAIAKVDRTERTALQNVGLTVYSQAYSKYVQADGSLGDDAYEFLTGQDGTTVIPSLGRGAFLIHETQPADGHVAGGDAIVSVNPTYTYEPVAISGLTAGADGDNVAQPDEGQQVVGETQDGVVGADIFAGTIALRLSSPASVSTRKVRGGSNLLTSSPTSYAIEVQKVDMATRQPVEHAGYRVATTLSGNTYYAMSDGTLSANQSNAYVFETDGEGKFTVPGLDAGSYVFHEVSHPQSYETGAPDFMVAITATRDSQTNELTALNATYTGGIDETRHRGSGYAGAREDGILSTSVATGKVSVRSSMSYVVPMPRAGLDGKTGWVLPVAISLSYASSVSLYLARRHVIEEEQVVAQRNRRQRGRARKRTHHTHRR